MNKKMNLGTALLLRNAPILILPIFYYTMVREHYTIFDSFIPVLTGGIFGALFAFYYNAKKEIKDERAQENKLKADSDSFKAAVLTLIIIIISIPVFNFAPIIIGYIISFDVVFIAILNVILFNVIDKRGV